MLQAVGSKTASDKANKGVMLVKTNGDSAGEPAGYVTKEVLAEIVRQELFSILSNDGSAATTLSKFIGLDGSSMKSITAGNLASVLGEVGYKTISVPANSSVPFPLDELSNKAFSARNGSASTVSCLFFKAGSGVQLARVAGTSSGLSINDESRLALHISHENDTWVIVNKQSSSQNFQYKVLL